MNISKIFARQIIDSRGNPTVEADVTLDDGTMGRAAVPSGASTGKYEAIELRDGDPKLYGGKSVLTAVKNVNTDIAQALVGHDVTDQTGIDQIMIDLDGTDNKAKLGANAILAVSLAVAHAAAAFKKEPLWKYFNSQATVPVEPTMPLPMMNILNGGKHANWGTDLQEYMIIPVGAKTFSEAIQMGTEVFHALEKVLHAKGYATSVGDEGGFAPVVKNGNQEPFELMSEAISNAGYEVGKDITFALDAAASEFYKDGKYNLKAEGRTLTSTEMIAWLQEFATRYPIVSMEDCLDQEDWAGWVKLTAAIGDQVQIVGDDLLVTNIKFIERGITERAANAVLIKLNQIGTLTETIKAIETARAAGWNAVVSHRSGETEDVTIAHLVVGLATGQIKTGSLCRSERIAKYNELLRIEEQFTDKPFNSTNPFRK